METGKIGTKQEQENKKERKTNVKLKLDKACYLL